MLLRSGCSCFRIPDLFHEQVSTRPTSYKTRGKEGGQQVPKKGKKGWMDWAETKIGAYLVTNPQ